MRFFRLTLLLLVVGGALLTTQFVYASDCTDTCGTDYQDCIEANPYTDSGSTQYGDYDLACYNTSIACQDECLAALETSSSTNTTTTTATSDTVSYTTADQTTYFRELQANGITFAYVSPDCKDHGECTLEDIMQVFTNIANFILGIVGSLTLIIFVYGGFLWLVSQGSSEKIEQGKTAMTGSVIGLVIVFVAFSAINLLTGALRGGTPDQTNKCELVSPAEGGMAGTGYACINTEGLDTTTDYTCEDNLCPGGETIKCCIKN